MLSEHIRPTSLVGIKRLARTIKVERAIPHIQALDEAAKRAGFENFRHAGNKLPQPGKSSQHRLYITAYWKDRYDSTKVGRETLWVNLSSPWAGLVTRSQMQCERRSLDSFNPEGPDHLVYKTLAISQSSARRVACEAVRTFQFIDATKLQPSRSHSRGYPGGSSSNAVPGRDHASTWYEPESKSFIFVDQPYEPAAKAKASERAAWSVKHGFEIVQPSWPGTYNPGDADYPGEPETGTRLYLIAPKEKGRLLSSLAAALDLLPTPVLETTWNGESAPHQPRFISPGAIEHDQLP